MSREKDRVKSGEIKDNKRRKKKKNRKVLRSIILIIVLLLIIGIGFAVVRVIELGGGWKGVTGMLLGHDKNTEANLEPFYCLVMGESEGLTDTIMLVAYHPKEKTAAILSIQRDTFVGTNPNKATGYDKINSLYRGRPSEKKDAQRTVDAVSEMTGIDIPYYAVIDTAGVRKLVDLLGGVYFDVPIDMNYDDYSQDLHIHLKKGYQKLDGDKAEQVLRFRHNNDKNGRITTTYPADYGVEDNGRMKTQQAFIMALLKQTLKAENLLKINNIIDIMHESLDTNITVNQVKDYVPSALEFDTSWLKTGTLPGEDKQMNGVWVRLNDKVGTKDIVEELFRSKEEETQSNEKTETAVIKKSDIKIELLNGSNKTSNLSNLNTKLKNAGYNVVKAEKTTSTAKTTIINRSKISEDLVADLKKAIGVGTTTTGDTSDKIDITIIIGNDYK